MKKNMLLVIFTSIIYFAYGNNKDSVYFQEQINLIKQENSSNKLTTQNIKDSLVKINEDIVYLKDKAKSFDWKNAIPWVLSIAAFIIAYRSYTRESSFKNLAFLIDSNKMKITDPALWSFYDAHAARYNSKIQFTSCSGFKIDGEEEFNINSNDKIEIIPSSGFVEIKQDEQTSINCTQQQDFNLKGSHHFKITGKAEVKINPAAEVSMKSREDIRLSDKLRAYSYYKLNSFELVFKYSKRDLSQSEIWENYMIDLILRSTCFRKVVDEESKGYLYNEEYRKKMKDFLILAHYIDKMTNEEDKAKVIKSRERIMNAYNNGDITLQSGIDDVGKRFD